MKKLLFLLTTLLFTNTLFAQSLSNEFYFRLGYSSPSWSQFGLDEGSWGELGIESKTGANFEIGSIFMIKSILDREDMSFGINADYLYLVFNQFETNHDFHETNLAIFRAGSKIGPSFTYSPVDKLEFDVYVKADMAWASGAVIYYTDIIDDAEDGYIGSIDLGFSSGINIRYGILMLGFEYNTNSSEMESDDYPGIYLQQIIDGDFETTLGKEKKSKLPCMNFTVGLSF